MVITAGGEPLVDPTDAELADRVGLVTAPAEEFYDLIVVGGGPAGLGAAVYSASEGLKTVLVERTATGGQAGQSSRIENYLGFPDGVSGAQLAERPVARPPSSAPNWSPPATSSRWSATAPRARSARRLSGGLDSPVAAYRMMKRGLHCDFVHFSGRPFTGPESVYKAYALAGRLDRFQGDSRLFVVSFGPAQRRLASAGAGRLQVLSQRRLMMKVASELGRREGAEALVTGDSRTGGLPDAAQSRAGGGRGGAAAAPPARRP